MWKQPNAELQTWLRLNETPIASVGARAFLASRRDIRRTPFVPITLFGFVLDDDPKIMAAPLDWNGAADAPGAVRFKRGTGSSQSR